MDIELLLQEGYIAKANFDKSAIDIEFNAGHYDLKSAEQSFEEEDFKWCTIKSYYAMFHFARALAYKKGYREKSHYGLSQLLDYLADTKQIDHKYVDYLKAGQSARQDADYQGLYTESTAKTILEFAQEFIGIEKYVIR